MSKIWAFIKKHKVLIIVLAILGVIIGWFGYNTSQIKNQLQIMDTATIEAEDLINSVKLDGLVESEDTKKIYTDLTLPVLENMVEVGDSVKEGDILGVLDVRKLEETIEQQRATVGAQEAVSKNSIELAQKQLEHAKGGVMGGTNAQLLQAEQGVILAEEQLNSAEVALEGAVGTVQEYRKVRRETGIDKDTGDVQLKAYETARDNAYAGYEAAKTNLATARESYEATKKATVQQVEGYTDTIESQKVQASTTQGQWIAIEHLEGDVGRAEVVSPIDGVVTAVYATEGATSTGLLYVVEDTTRLKVTAALKEYDLTYVHQGDNAIIKSDATGDEEYNGKLDKIAPTTLKTATGDNKSDGTGEFSTKITVADPKNSLKIGTKARVDVIYSKKDNVLTVPYEAIGVNKANEDVIYVLEVSPDDEKTYNVRQVPIELGIEGDFKIEIKTGDVNQGSMVIKNVEGLVFDEENGLQIHIMSDVDALAKEGHVQAYMLTLEG